jgi:hypothetical protein
MMSRETTRITIQRGQFAGHVEAFGEKAIDCVADAGDDKEREGDFHLAGGNRPDDNRHQQDAGQRNDIRNTQLGRFPATGLIFTGDSALCRVNRLLSR